MSFDPFRERGIPLDRQTRTWSELNVEPYKTEAVHPYTRCRVILMNEIEVEAAMFGHQFNRHSSDLQLKQTLAQVRRLEQQKAVNWRLPAQENTLEVTIGYEQVAVDLTAWLARNEPDPYLTQVYDFGLLEDFDHHTSSSHQLMSALRTGVLMRDHQGLEMPTTLQSRHASMLDNLNQATDEDFDNRYLEQQKLAHAETATLLSGYAAKGDNPQLCSVARSALPMVQRHAAMVERIGRH